MKKFLIFLVIILVISIIVLPLIFVAIGKFKNPVDRLSDNFAQRRGLMTQPNISQNFIPAPGGVSDSGSTKDRITEANKESEECIGGMVNLLAHAYDMSENKDQKNIIELPGNTNWYLNGFDLTDLTKSKETTQGIMVSVNQLNPERVCKQPEIIYYGSYHDSGYFAQTYLKGILPGFTQTNKGLVGINRSRYHWYLYESNTKLDLSSRKNQNSFMVIYTTLNDGKEYKYMFTGNTNHYTTATQFLAKTQALLANIKYGDTTRVQQ